MSHASPPPGRASLPRGRAASAVLVGLLALAAALFAPRDTERDDLARHFAERGLAGTFAVLDLAAGTTLRVNAARAGEGFPPASTFKIPNTLIFLETGVADGPDFSLPWDGVERSVPNWNRDQTLESAFRNSAVWYYVELARRVGHERIKGWLERIGYGNADVAGGERFWIDGALRVSANGQIDFLKRLYLGTLPFAAAHMDTVKRFMVLETTPAYTLSGKTGATTAGGRTLGWLVGWLERDGRAYIFALNIEGGAYTPEFLKARIDLARTLLAELGLLPAPEPPSTDKKD